ncbi:MAG: phosphate signaling complex protein PhoU [Planctomycetota bacterium]
MPVRFDEELATLKRDLVAMGAAAEGMIEKAIAALMDRDRSLLPAIMAEEERMDQFQRRIDDEAVRLITVYTPVASNLRLIMMATRINAELERVGDQVVTMCHSYETLKLLEEPPLKPLLDLPRMARTAARMVHEALEVFLTGSPEKAMAVIRKDDEVDQLNDQIFRELLTHMMADPRSTGRALGLILVARAVERIADHAVNIAEDVVFMVKGEDIRHTGS